MVGWHHPLNGHEFEQTPGDSENQGSLRAALHGVTKSQTRLSDRTTTTKVVIPSILSPAKKTKKIKEH